MEPYMNTSGERAVGGNENFKRFLQCNTKEEMTDFYGKWAKDNVYEKHMKDGYAGPKGTVDGLLRHCTGRLDLSILDVGAGSGLVGQELKDKGFTGTIDALDPSAEMLDNAKERNVYTKFYQCYFGDSDESKSIESNSYDAIVSSGAIGFGHMETSSLFEMIRIVKQGGLISVANAKGALIDDQENNEASVLSALEDSGQLERLELSTIPGFFFDLDGELFVFKVNRS